MNINQIRKEMGFSQQELAGWLGLSRTQVADFENGQRCPTRPRANGQG